MDEQYIQAHVQPGMLGEFRVSFTLPEGADVARFTDNPVVFFAHDWDKVVGQGKELSVSDGVLSMRVQLQPPSRDDEFFSSLQHSVAEGAVKLAELYIRDGEVMTASLVSVPTIQRMDGHCSGPCCPTSDPPRVLRLDRQETPMSHDTIPTDLWKQPLRATRDAQSAARQDGASDHDHDSRIAEVHARYEQSRRDNVAAFRRAKEIENKKRLDANEPIQLPQAHHDAGLPQRWREPLAASSPKVQADTLHSIAQALSRRPPPDSAA